MASCPSDLQLQALVDERLEPADEAWIVAHVETCKPCQDRLDDLTSGCQPHPSWLQFLRDQPWRMAPRHNRQAISPKAPSRSFLPVRNRTRPTNTPWISGNSQSSPPPPTLSQSMRKRLMVAAPVPSTPLMSRSITRWKSRTKPRLIPDSQVTTDVISAVPIELESGSVNDVDTAEGTECATTQERRPNSQPDRCL